MDLSSGQSGELPVFHNRDKWFEGHVCRELAYLKGQIAGLPTAASRQLARCAFSAIIVSVSNQESETRWCAKRQDVPLGGTLGRFAARLTDSLERVASFEAAAPDNAAVYEGDARRLPLKDASVDLIVCSPPYANAHDYYLYNKLRLFWLGHEVRSVQQAEIGSRNKHSDLGEGIDSYSDSMTDVLREVRRVLKASGKAAFVVGDAVIRGQFYPMHELLGSAARDAGLALTDYYRFEHRQFNAAFQRGFGRANEKQTHVLVLRPDENA